LVVISPCATVPAKARAHDGYSQRFQATCLLRSVFQLRGLTFSRSTMLPRFLASSCSARKAQTNARTTKTRKLKSAVLSTTDPSVHVFLDNFPLPLLTALPQRQQLPRAPWLVHAKCRSLGSAAARARCLRDFGLRASHRVPASSGVHG